MDIMDTWSLNPQYSLYLSLLMQTMVFCSRSSLQYFFFFPIYRLADVTKTYNGATHWEKCLFSFQFKQF